MGTKLNTNAKRVTTMLDRNVTLTDFRNKFASYDRADAFSYEGLAALYKLDELRYMIGFPVSVDVIGLCSNFKEYDNLDDALSNYENTNSLKELRKYKIVLKLKKGRLIVGNH